MTIDVDNVSEKLSGLVNLLKIVGIDGVDQNALVAEQKRLTGNKKDGSSSGTGATAQSTDSSQILELIKKLQQAQAESPEILKALQSPEILALVSLAAAKNSAPAPAPATLEDVMDDDSEDNYPKIGPGYSDEISVVSDLTTPTVMTKQSVREEEYYRDVNGGPPVSVGTSKPPNSIGDAGRRKSRNILSSVSAAASQRAALKGGGAAAQRRANYQSTMAKLQQPVEAKSPKLKKGKEKKSSDKKKKKKSCENDEKSKGSKGSKDSITKGDGIDWGTCDDDADRPSFDKFDTTFGDDPFGTSTENISTIVDADGFFTSDVFANVDPFAQQTPPVNSNSSSKNGKKKKPRKPKDDGQGTGGDGRNRSDKQKERRASRRRRSTGM